METRYCENDNCGVLIFEFDTAHPLQPTNCPGCGRMGRKKGKQ